MSRPQKVSVEASAEPDVPSWPAVDPHCAEVDVELQMHLGTVSTGYEMYDPEERFLDVSTVRVDVPAPSMDMVEVGPAWVVLRTAHGVPLFLEEEGLAQLRGALDVAAEVLRRNTAEVAEAWSVLYPESFGDEQIGGAA